MGPTRRFRPQEIPAESSRGTERDGEARQFAGVLSRHGEHNRRASRAPPRLMPAIPKKSAVIRAPFQPASQGGTARLGCCPARTGSDISWQQHDAPQGFEFRVRLKGRASPRRHGIGAMSLSSRPPPQSRNHHDESTPRQDLQAIASVHHRRLERRGAGRAGPGLDVRLVRRGILFAAVDSRSNSGRGNSGPARLWLWRCVGRGGPCGHREWRKHRSRRPARRRRSDRPTEQPRSGWGPERPDREHGRP
jgi:hypothetical protein